MDSKGDRMKVTEKLGEINVWLPTKGEWDEEERESGNLIKKTFNVY